MEKRLVIVDLQNTAYNVGRNFKIKAEDISIDSIGIGGTLVVNRFLSLIKGSATYENIIGRFQITIDDYSFRIALLGNKENVDAVNVSPEFGPESKKTIRLDSKKKAALMSKYLMNELFIYMKQMIQADLALKSRQPQTRTA